MSLLRFIERLTVFKSSVPEMNESIILESLVVQLIEGLFLVF